MRRQQLSAAQITALLDPPTDQRELVRHYTLFAADLAAIRRCRGDHNRLGHALMRCYLRYPGRPLKAGERPPRPLLLFIAAQIDALPEAIEDYLAAERNRRRHAAELQDRLGFRPFGRRPAADLTGWLLPRAIENDRLAHLAGLVVEECRRRRIVVPSPGALERMLPRIRITDLLSEVARWTLFTDCFTHLRTGETAADSQVLMASLLADGLNLGLTRMAEACSIASLGQLAWISDWHIRDETYALALRRLINQQQREPLAAMFGSGFASSSDGQFFRAGGFGRDGSSINAHYGDEPGVKFYTHLSDRYAPFHTKVIAATASEAAHVLDGLLYHQSEVAARRHHTDGGGDSDHVFALCSLLGFQFAPRIPDLKSRRLYSFGKASAYPSLEPLIAGRINGALIRAHWSEILRVAASIHTGTVAASLILRQLASYPRQNGLAAALRELGRLERTLFTLDWLEDRELRRQTSQELNKGETRNSLARAVFIHRLGEIRDRTYENQQHRASGLNLLVTAIILWNTRYLERAIATLRQVEDVPDQLLAHLSPLGWEHVNLTGDYNLERRATGRGKLWRIPPAQGHARCRAQGRLSSWFVRLCVKSRRFVTSGLIVVSRTRGGVPWQFFGCRCASSPTYTLRRGRPGFL